MKNKEVHEETKTSFDWKFTLLVSVLIASVGLGLLLLIFSTEPRATRSAGAKKTAMLVDVIQPDTGSFRPWIHATGTVRPAREIVLRPRVEGKIVKRNENFTPGGFVEKGDTLVELDSSDYENTLLQRKSALGEARAELEIEQGNQAVAQYEYRAIGDQIQGEDKSLVLREPQLKIAKSAVQRARQAVDQAQLDLNRTTIEAPFNAHVLSLDVNIGSQAAVGESLGRLVGYDTYWVETTVPLSKLRWLSIPDTSSSRGSKVRIQNPTSWPSGTYRMGRLYKLIGELEDRARMARVLISVSDPLVRMDASADSPVMISGSFVETKIKGKTLKNVIRLKSEYVRKDDTVWVMKDDQLDIREVEILFQNERYAYIQEGLAADDQIVTTNLSTVVEGTPLRTKASQSVNHTAGDTKVSWVPNIIDQRIPNRLPDRKI